MRVPCGTGLNANSPSVSIGLPRPSRLCDDDREARTSGRSKHVNSPVISTARPSIDRSARKRVPAPDRLRRQQLDLRHLPVVARLVAFVGDKVEHRLGRWIEDLFLDVRHQLQARMQVGQTALGTLPVSVKTRRIARCPRSAVAPNMQGSRRRLP